MAFPCFLSFSYYNYPTSYIPTICPVARTKAVSRGWREGELVETWHIDDTSHSGRSKTSAATALFIIQTITKNSTTSGHVHVLLLKLQKLLVINLF